MIYGKVSGKNISKKAKQFKTTYMSFFEKITDGLHSYEVIIMILGSLMFIALIIMMIIYAAQKRTLKPLFMFFVVPLLMLVWPSVQKIKIDGKGAEIVNSWMKLRTIRRRKIKKNWKDLSMILKIEMSKTLGQEKE